MKRTFSHHDLQTYANDAVVLQGRVERLEAAFEDLVQALQWDARAVEQAGVYPLGTAGRVDDPMLTECRDAFDRIRSMLQYIEEWARLTQRFVRTAELKRPPPDFGSLPAEFAETSAKPAKKARKKGAKKAAKKATAKAVKKAAKKPVS